MKKGYDVFSKAYGVMLRNDLHAKDSIDHKLMQEMILLDESSYNLLYQQPPTIENMENHEVFSYAQQFKSSSDHQTIKNVIKHLCSIASGYNTPFEDMLFGGTEKEILDRGTDWCSDMARVCTVLLKCLGIPARIVQLANTDKAYNGHAAVEAYYEGKYGFCDPVYGNCFHKDKPIDVYEIIKDKSILNGMPKDYAGLFSAAALCDYDPNDPNNKYIISRPNDYYLTLIGTSHNDKWIMNEEKQ